MSVDPYTRPQHWEPMNTPARRAPRCYSRQSKFVSWSDVDAESNTILIALIIASSIAVFLLVYTWTL